ncbi:hypothetical protein Pmar_PMAR010586 [Perkinsus marinus ATCC 50983]|uniref:Reverse transcriptase domain-containing protein n=1 Tax=Perkinsus marinus (strain ATCC 50983 / TXsc) TaxID=423536 RepID=C5KA75_PERM5|nr:hypothetical protein Pmar_PMAR010586 [Perkinsus marinus ATCC 50983]EER18618.1 hypothetical protein Pmar_PMAR010586 [Perkinsus marinus ATCC 50983]|eukprot:XP_002786822.1 hypothetical protein Pmar_PMAR010586 [Perkinsus marinus ATCC 50983]
MAMATTEDEDPHLEVVNEVMEIEPMAYSMSTGVGSIDGSSQGLLLSDIIDNKPWRVRLTIGQRPEGASPNEPSPCCHIDGLLDSGAGANFVSTAVVKFALRRNLIDAHLLRTLNPIKITYGNGQTAICTRAIKLPIRFSLHSSLNDEAPSMVWLHCLMVKDTKPSIIVGRPGMATLGVRATIPSWAYKDPTSCSSHDTVLCHSALSTRSTTFEKGTITDTSRIDYDSPTDISFYTTREDNGARRLCVRAPCFETAKVIPFSEKMRPRSVLESAILHSRVLQMYREGKVELISAADAIIILETVLVDKLATGNGPKPPRPYHLPDADLKKRYRVTVDARPVNNLQLTVAGNKFQWVPRSVSSGMPKADLESPNQHQQGPIDILNNWPSFATTFYGRLDLSDAFYSISIPERVRSLFCFRTTCTVMDDTGNLNSLGDSFLWRLCRLPQGWTYPPLIFTRALSHLLYLFRAQCKLRVHIDHYQDDLLLGAADEKTLNQCIETSPTPRSYGSS